MHMTKIWGYNIAKTPNDKSKRACYRFAKNDCVVYDMSYYIPVNATHSEDGADFIKENETSGISFIHPSVNPESDLKD